MPDFVKTTVGYNSNGRGFITLLSILFIGTLGASLAISMLFKSIDASRNSSAYHQGIEARLLADACAEEALKSIRDSLPVILEDPAACTLDCPTISVTEQFDAGVYTGTRTLEMGNGTCRAQTVSLGGGNRSVSSTGTVGKMNRKLKVVTSSSNQIVSITSWQEVADF